MDTGGQGEQLLNVVDVEATCWEGQPPPGQVSEIIEIGLTVVDL
ncbi:DNA polymerase III, partial [Streptomyces caelestis]